MVDLWIHGQGTGSHQEYLVRTQSPRCIICITDDLEAAQKASHEGLVNDYGEFFYVAQWIDPRPDSEKVLEIMKQAVYANELFTLDSDDD